MFGNTFKAGKKQMIPVQAWAIVLAVAALIFWGVASIDLMPQQMFRNTHEMRYATYKVRLNNLRKAENRRPDEYRVLLFGSSLTAQGVMQDSFFNDRFRQLGKPIRVSRIFYAGAFYKMLEDPDLLSYLESVRPDLLCVEDQALLYDPLPGLDWPKPPLATLQGDFVFNLNALKHLLLPSVFPKPGLARKIDPSLTFDVKYPQADSVISHQDSTEYEIEMRTVRKIGKTKKFNKLMDQLRDQGSDIAILQLPRPEKIEHAYLTERSLRKKEELLEQYQKQYGLTYWTFTRNMPFRYYWDISHLNKHGQLIFSESLFVKILDHYDRRASVNK